MYTIKQPAASESGDYFKTYIGKVPTDDFKAQFTISEKETLTLLGNLPLEKWDYRYGPDKWTIKEVMLHIIDTERIMAYRALRIARNDQTPMPGFDQDAYMPFVNVDQRNVDSIINEYKSVRAATVSLFAHFDDETLARLGTASNQPFSTRALGFIIAGHEIHHMEIIKERYL